MISVEKLIEEAQPWFAPTGENFNFRVSHLVKIASFFTDSFENESFQNV